MDENPYTSPRSSDLQAEEFGPIPPVDFRRVIQVLALVFVPFLAVGAALALILGWQWAHH